MARIAFFTEKLPPSADPIAEFSYDLISSLAELQHDVLVISTYKEGDVLPAPRRRVELVRPFRTWSWLELPRAMTTLLNFQPDILHVIQPRAEALQGMTNAMSAIPGLQRLLGRPALVSSFYDMQLSSLKTHRSLLLASDVNTVMNQSQKSLVKQFYFDNNRGGTSDSQITILPAPWSYPMVTQVTSSEEASTTPFPTDSISEALQEFLNRSEKTLYIPGEISAHQETHALFKSVAHALQKFPESQALFMGGWGQTTLAERRKLMEHLEQRHVGDRVLFSGPLAPLQERHCMAKSYVVFAASLPCESLNLIRVTREALQVATPLVLTRAQALDSAFAGLSSPESQALNPDSKNKFAFIQQTSNAPTSERYFNSLCSALESSEVVANIRSRLPEQARFEAADRPSNVMSRIYARLLDRRN